MRTHVSYRRRYTSGQHLLTSASHYHLERSNIRWLTILVVIVLALLGGIAAPVSAATSGPSDDPATSDDPAHDPDFDTDTAQRFVDEYTQRHGLRGAAYVVTKEGDPVAQGASGGVITDTPMAIASMSKAFTAFAGLQQVDSDDIDLGARVTDYLPEFAVQGPRPARLTLR